MKSLLIFTISLLSFGAFATGGIDCKGIDSKLDISTEEAMAEGNSLIGVYISDPSIMEKPLRIDGRGAILIVSRQIGPRGEEAMYLASKGGTTITLYLNSDIRDEVLVSNAIIVHGNKTYNKQVTCSSGVVDTPRNVYKMKIVDKASIISQLLQSDKLDINVKKDLSQMFSGAIYGYRASILSFVCKYRGRSSMVDCSITIGTDNLLDDDEGWGSIYEINSTFNARDKNKTIRNVRVLGVAG